MLIRLGQGAAICIDSDSAEARVAVAGVANPHYRCC